LGITRAALAGNVIAALPSTAPKPAAPISVNAILPIFATSSKDLERQPRNYRAMGCTLYSSITYG
jgi:hypothetical protein